MHGVGALSMPGTSLPLGTWFHFLNSFSGENILPYVKLKAASPALRPLIS